MTVSAYLGVLGGLALVLGLITLLAKPLRALSLRTRSGARGEELEVLSRVALAPRQGIAVVRFGKGRALVSYGDGGVRLLMEGEDVQQRGGEDDTPSANSFAVALRATQGKESETGRRREAGTPGPLQIWNRVRTAARGVGFSLLLAGLVQGGAPRVAAAASNPGDEIPVLTVPAPQEQSPPVIPAPGTAPIQGQTAPAQGQTAPAQGQTAPAPLPDAGTVLSAVTRSFQNVEVRMGEGEDAFRLSGPVGTVVLMGVLTLLPTLILLMTGFTRILVVLHLLRQALGTQAAPPAHLLAAMALLLTGFVMAPTFSEVNRTALAPWMAGEMGEAEMLQAAVVPFRGFMLGITREQDLQTFLEIQGGPLPETVDEVSTVVVTSAFITSELRNAFQMGFALFLPFVVIDLVVASVLMSMGMFMLPPVMVSLPFKLLLFVLVDGWGLVVGGLVRSFGV